MHTNIGIGLDHSTDALCGSRRVKPSPSFESLYVEAHFLFVNQKLGFNVTKTYISKS